MPSGNNSNSRLPWTLLMVTWCISLAALCLSCSAAKSCTFLEQNVSAFGFGEDLVHLGLFRFQNDDYLLCINYNTIDGFKKTSELKAAEAFAILAALFGGIGVLVLSCLFFLPTRVLVWRALIGVFSCCVVFQSLTFLMFAGDMCKGQVVGGRRYNYKCTFERGAILSVVAIVTYLLAAIFMLIASISVPANALFVFKEGAVGSVNNSSNNKSSKKNSNNDPEQPEPLTASNDVSNPTNPAINDTSNIDETGADGFVNRIEDGAHQVETTTTEIFHNEDGTTRTVTTTTMRPVTNTPSS